MLCAPGSRSISNGCIKNKHKDTIMKAIRSFVTRHPLVMYFGLAYAFAWSPWLLYATVPNFPSGIQLTFGPFLAAVTVSALTGGWAGVKAYLRGLLRWRASVHRYALALALPVVLALVTGSLNVLFGAAQPSSAQLAGITAFFPGFALMLLPMSPAVEELGWRGYAQPRLQAERSALTASVIVGILHTAWHLPLFLVPTSDQSQANTPFVAFLIFTVAFNVLVTWLYNSTRGSVVIAMIFHASIDAILLAFVVPLFSGVDQVRLWWLLAAVLSLAAGLVVLVMGPNLGRTRSTPMALPDALTGEAERAA
jgi:membrane protease YdiL (CAAX protease family)